MNEPTTAEAEYEAPSQITVLEVCKVGNKLAMREPVHPNTVWRCLRWAAERIVELEDGVERVAEFAHRVAKEVKDEADDL